MSTNFLSMKALLSSLRTVETMAPAAGTASTDASMHADSAAGASTPSLLNLELSLDITVIRLPSYHRADSHDRTAERSASRAVSDTNAPTCARAACPLWRAQPLHTYNLIRCNGHAKPHFYASFSVKGLSRCLHLRNLSHNFYVYRQHSFCWFRFGTLVFQQHVEYMLLKFTYLL